VYSHEQRQAVKRASRCCSGYGRNEGVVAVVVCCVPVWACRVSVCSRSRTSIALLGADLVFTVIETDA
jgi:hypothetical protein